MIIKKINGFNNIVKQQIDTDIETYNNLKTDLTTFKNKKFGKPYVEYDENTGRVKSMSFTNAD